MRVKSRLLSDWSRSDLEILENSAQIGNLMQQSLHGGRKKAVACRSHFKSFVELTSDPRLINMIARAAATTNEYT